MDDEQHIISTELQNWFRTHKRDLPWRSTRNPYKIWVSEVVLQQTRVAQGMSYYQRFISRFPDVVSLASAEQDEVLKLWQGLGYYSRARNMHFAAKQVVESFGGIFPNNFDNLLKLKGVGEYTAAAVSSIADNEPVAVVDGNVDRVLSRLFLVELPVNSTEGKKQIKELAKSILDKKNAGDHNQAVMELGALICSPKNPQCDTCPVENYCVAKQKKKQLDLPVKLKKIKQRNRFFQYFFVRSSGSLYMRKRKAGDIWDGLYELILIETEKEADASEAIKLFNQKFNVRDSDYSITSSEAKYKHILSHQVIYAAFYAIDIVGDKEIKLDGYEKIEWSGVPELPIARITDRYLKEFNVFE